MPTETKPASEPEMTPAERIGELKKVTPTAAPKAETFAERLAKMTPKERLAAISADLKDKRHQRKPYRLCVVSTPERPAPFYAVDVAGRTFHKTSGHYITPDPRNPNHRELEARRGLIQFLTDDEIADVRRRIPDFIVRWLSRENMRAQVIDAARAPNVGMLNPETDEPLEDYLRIEEVRGETAENAADELCAIENERKARRTGKKPATPVGA